ncbi:MAG: thiol peroxidase [Deltaproteobacteria bacterium]|nr:thiol peroxidase [Deltaproteobacteria bacterium]
MIGRDGPIKLAGTPVEEGQKAPGFTVVGNDMKPVSLSDFAGKIVIISVVPSLDTPTCDLQTRTFNEKASALGEDFVVLTISMDLPFAQKRWCGAKGVDRVITLSDHREASFGKAYGVLMPEPRLLARAVFVVDQKGVIRLVHVVENIGMEPNYDLVLSAAKKLAE